MYFHFLKHFAKFTWSTKYIQDFQYKVNVKIGDDDDANNDNNSNDIIYPPLFLFYEEASNFFLFNT